MLGVQEYAIKKLGVKSVELKWGQGAKDIGGEVKISDLNKAQELQRRGYVVLPDPIEPAGDRGLQARRLPRVRAPLARRHGEPRTASCKRVEELRKCGAKHITLKTGAYRPADLARAVKYASLAEIDLLTVDARRRRHRHEPLAHDERVGHPRRRAALAAARVPAASCASKGEFIPPRAGRRLHLRGPDVQGLRPGRAVRQADRHGARARWPRPWSPRPSARPSRRRTCPSTSSASALAVDEIFVTAPRAAAQARRPLQQAAGGRHRRLHLLPAAGAGSAAAHGRRAQVRAEVHRPQRHLPASRPRALASAASTTSWTWTRSRPTPSCSPTAPPRPREAGGAGGQERQGTEIGTARDALKTGTREQSEPGAAQPRVSFWVV